MIVSFVSLRLVALVVVFVLVDEKVVFEVVDELELVVDSVL